MNTARGDLKDLHEHAKRLSADETACDGIQYDLHKLRDVRHLVADHWPDRLPILDRAIAAEAVLARLFNRLSLLADAATTRFGLARAGLLPGQVIEYTWGRPGAKVQKMRVESCNGIGESVDDAVWIRGTRLRADGSLSKSQETIQIGGDHPTAFRPLGLWQARR